MNAELGRRFVNLGRATIAAGMLWATPGAFESPKNFGRNLQNPFSVSTADAGELYSPLEQLAIYNEALQRYSTLLAKKDLAGLEKYSPGDSNFSWESAGAGPSDYRTKAEFLALLRQALARSEPKCVGYVQSRRATEYRILFENFSLGNRPDASGYSYIVLGIVPFEDGVSSVLRGVEEVAKKDLETVKSSVTPCKTETQAVPKPEIPPELAKTKFIYTIKKDDSRVLYQANLEKNENLALVDSATNPLSADWLDNDTLVYSSGQGTFFDYPWSGIRMRNLKTGKDELLFDEEKGKESRNSCPTTDSKGNVWFIRSERGFFFTEDIYISGKEQRGVRPLTEINKKTISCPKFSPDGKMLALYSGIRAVDAGRGEIQVYSTETFEADYSAERPLYRFRGIDVFDWSPDGNKLLIRRVTRQSDNSFSDRGYTIDLRSGKEEIVGGDFISAIWSADQNWVLASVRTGQKGSAIQGYKLGIAEPITIFKSEGEIDSLKRYSERKVFVPERNTIILFPGLGSVIKNGKYTGGVFDDLVEIFKYEMGYNKDEDILLASLGGSTFDSQGRHIPKDQDCTDTLRDQDTNGTVVAQLLREYARLNPNKQITLITHSLGSIGTLRGLEQLLNNDPDFDFSRIKLIITHGPNLGIDKPAWQYLFAPLRVFDLPPDCNLDLGLFKTPFPSEINYPALVELKDMWERLPQTIKDRASHTARLTARGAKVYALGSFQDCVIDSLACYMPDFLSEIKMLTNPGKFTSLTQELPGAVNIMRHLGHRGVFGHDTMLKTEEGQAIVTTLVGRQLKTGN